MPLLIPHRPRGRHRDHGVGEQGKTGSWQAHIVWVRGSGWLQQTRQESCILPLGVQDFAKCWWCCCWMWPCWPARLLLDLSASQPTLNPCLLWPIYCRLGGGTVGLTLRICRLRGKRDIQVNHLIKNIKFSSSTYTNASCCLVLSVLFHCKLETLRGCQVSWSKQAIWRHHLERLELNIFNILPCYKLVRLEWDWGISHPVATS